ncbi:uncharacterized protein POS17_1197 [Pseudomonas sp. Os17]|nr:uncharacterized protein POS17_1197 [Pseudomonas sp. Os17]
MLRRQQQFMRRGERCKSPVSSLTGGLFKTGTSLHLHANHFQGHAQGITDRLAMIRPGIRRFLQPMVDMHSLQCRQALPVRQTGKQVQQDSGVKTTGEGDTPDLGIEPGPQTVQ